jgi:hypothetical protein
MVKDSFADMSDVKGYKRDPVLKSGYWLEVGLGGVEKR